jgi:hypothetical protein
MITKIARYGLMIFLVLLGLGGLIEGTTLLIDPNRAEMGLSAKILGNLPIIDFVIPGLLLIAIMGVSSAGDNLWNMAALELGLGCGSGTKCSAHFVAWIANFALGNTNSQSFGLPHLWCITRDFVFIAGSKVWA